MKITTTIFAACLCLSLVNALPFNGGLQSQALDQLMVDETVNDPTYRSKRTIGILRQLFPDLTKMIEDKVNAIIGEIIKVLGPVVFQSILGNNNNNNNNNNANGNDGASKSSGSTVNAKNPFDDDDDVTSFTDDDDFFNAPVKPSNNDNGGSKISLDLPTVKNVESSTTAKIEDPVVISSSSSPVTELIITTTNSAEEPTTLIDDGVTNSDPISEASENNQVVSEADGHGQAESQNNEVRVQFADETQSQSSNDASNDGELAPLEDEDPEDRNKRFLNFGFGSSSGNGNGNGGSGGGSGNFIFDIIRQAADSAARAAGTVYRVVAGTQSLGLGLSASRDIGPAPLTMGNDNSAMTQQQVTNNQQPPSSSSSSLPSMMPGAMANGTNPPLVAGSGSSGSNDPAAGAPTAGPQTEAVPGPVTRLFVIANRGISNLIQDLILRLAATSERIVNFKARLITSII